MRVPFLAVSCRPSLCGHVGALCVLLLFVSVRQVDGQSLGWAKQAVGGDFDYASAGAVDGSGNIYVTGSFNRVCGCGGHVTFDAGGPNETTLTGVGSADAFVAKYDSSGALVWAKSASTTVYDDAFGIAVDAAGNSYIAILRSHMGGQVIKFDSSGSEVWTTTLRHCRGRCRQQLHHRLRFRLAVGRDSCGGLETRLGRRASVDQTSNGAP